MVTTNNKLEFLEKYTSYDGKVYDIYFYNQEELTNGDSEAVRFNLNEEKDIVFEQDRSTFGWWMKNDRNTLKEIASIVLKIKIEENHLEDGFKLYRLYLDGWDGKEKTPKQFIDFLNSYLKKICELKESENLKVREIVIQEDTYLGHENFKEYCLIQYGCKIIDAHLYEEYGGYMYFKCVYINAKSNLIKKSSLINMFFSYSSIDKVLAGKIKDNLEDSFGFSIFLAHNDLDGLEEWKEEILIELQSCDCFLALINDNFKNSEWTDQELGHALSRNIPIFPINAGKAPYGFISNIQGICLRDQEADITRIADKIGNNLLANANLKEKFLTSIINMFVNSKSYNEANRKVLIVKRYHDSFSKPQKEKLLKYSLWNNQILDAHGCRSYIQKLKEELS